ncbi:MAG: methyltransferase domain-containing protein [Pararhizobium sp.]
MDHVFDRALIAARARRAGAAATAGADFLLRRAADDLGSRVSIVERRFEAAGILDDPTGVVAAAVGAARNVSGLRPIAVAMAEAGAVSERIAEEPATFDLIVSALGLHLVNDTPGLLLQIRRLLKPDGLFLAAIPAAGTLQELRESLLAAEAETTGGASPRVIPFGDVRDYGALLQRAAFALPVADVETLTVRYDTLFDLICDLRAMGMTNPLVDRSRRHVGRAFFGRAAEIYAERFSDPDGRIRATFSFVYLSGWAPHESQQTPLKPGSARSRLADALKTTERKL